MDVSASPPTLDEATTSTWWSPWPDDGRLYNISNFGDRNACYADVDAADARVFFLTLFDGRLSAHYDDLFGAVADWTADSEQEILHALGQLHLVTTGLDPPAAASQV